MSLIHLPIADQCNIIDYGIIISNKTPEEDKWH